MNIKAIMKNVIGNNNKEIIKTQKEIISKLSTQINLLTEKINKYRELDQNYVSFDLDYKSTQAETEAIELSCYEVLDKNGLFLLFDKLIKLYGNKIILNEDNKTSDFNKGTLNGILILKREIKKIGENKLKKINEDMKGVKT